MHSKSKNTATFVEYINRSVVSFEIKSPDIFRSTSESVESNLLVVNYMYLFIKHLSKTINFLFFQGWDDVSFHGNPEIPTPNIDRIANHGVILQQYYTTPFCEESVTAFRTGKHPIHYSKFEYFFFLPILKTRK